jgi:acetyl-CoA/propionyl-CoA carboxylase carboxyl transferase subunit
MGAAAAVGVLHRRKLAAAPAGEREALLAQLVAEQERDAGGVAKAVEIGVVDDVIDPARTRSRLAAALAELPPRRGTHTNIPL